MPYIKMGMLSSYCVPLPPLSVQEQIVSELNAYQKIIDGAQQIIENWKPAFVSDPDWKEYQFSDFVDFQEGPGILAVDFQEKGVPLLRLKGLESEYASLDGCNFLSPAKVEQKWPHFRLEDGDILLSSSGSLGRVSEVDEETVGAIAYTGIIRFRPVNKKLDRKFLKYYLMSDHFVNQAQSYTTGIGLKHFGPTHIKKMSIFIPPIDEQRKIIDEIESELSTVNQVKILKDSYIEKTDAVISKLWSD